MKKMRCVQVCGALVMTALAAIAACRPKVAPAPPPRADVIVLVPDPEDGRIGSATVSTPGGRVELTAAESATRVTEGQAPTTPTPIAAGDIQRRFGDAMEARPLPPRQFLLYFETGDVALTPASAALLTEILEVVRTRPAPDVSVIGHTDTVGDAKSNVQLGMRRAILIRDLLVKTGVDSTQVDVASHGEAALLVATRDDTEEPKNRRGEVTIR